jgi:hypothetical protein
MESVLMVDLRPNHCDVALRASAQSHNVKLPRGAGKRMLRVRHSALKSNFRLGFAKTSDSFAFFPLATLLKHLEALEALKHIPLSAQGGGSAQTTML